MSTLFSSLLDDDRPGFLTDDLVDQTVGNGNVGRRFKRNFSDPILNRCVEHLVGAGWLRRPDGGHGLFGSIRNLFESLKALFKGFIGRGHGFFGHAASSPSLPFRGMLWDHLGKGSKRIHQF